MWFKPSKKKKNIYIYIGIGIVNGVAVGGLVLWEVVLVIVFFWDLSRTKSSKLSKLTIPNWVPKN